MLKFSLTLLVVIFLFLPEQADASHEITLLDLRCENLTNPLGIATVIPGLSWKIKGERNGTAQIAYQILAASDSLLLNENEADLWNPGKTISEASVLVPWNGNKLKARSVVYWKVRIWNENNKATAWSQINSFSVGLLAGEDWHAAYIGMPHQYGNPESPLLRAHFKLSGKAEKRLVYINSLGYHEIFINGKKVGDGILAPAVSQLNKRSLSLTYDVSPYLKEGENDLIIWLGRGWYSPTLPGVAYDGPLVKARIEELVKGKWSTLVATDSSWKVRESGYTCIGTGKGGNFGGEKVNGAMLLRDLSAKSLNKASWHPVYTANIPEIQVTPQTVELNRIMGTIGTSSIKPFGKDAWLVDMGKTLTGRAEIKFPALHPGQEVVMEYSDHLNKEGHLADQHQEDRYIATGIGKESFCSKFNYHGFRYLKISNLTAEPKKENINAFLIHTGYREAAAFQCSDTDLNTIHNMLYYTLRCLSINGYLVDCPTVERLGYGGDGNASTLTAQTMFDLGPLYSNWLQAWADCIREDGGMPHTAPCPYPAGGGPYWCGFIITATYKTYLNYGDIRLLEKYYPVMQKWLGYVAKYSPDGMLHPWPETDYRGWYLGDWADPEGVDQKNKTSIDLVNNCFVSQCLEKMEKIALTLGKKSDAANYALQNEKLKIQIHATFFDLKSSSYASGSQIDLIYPLLTQIVPDSLAPKIIKTLQNEITINRKGHIATGLVGIPIFTEWAVKNHSVDLFYNMLKKRDYPGYLYMVDNGATTTWEHWSGDRSRIHNCYNGIGSWFYQAVGGIRPDDNHPGYREFFIDPQIPEGITWAKTTKETPYGTIVTNWTLENNQLTLTLEIPVGCTAKVVLPGKTKDYLLNGTSKSLIPQKEPALITLGSGKYTLSYTR